MASHPTQNQQKMHQHYCDSNGAKYRDINSNQLSRYIAIYRNIDTITQPCKLAHPFLRTSQPKIFDARFHDYNQN